MTNGITFAPTRFAFKLGRDPHLSGDAMRDGDPSQQRGGQNSGAGGGLLLASLKSRRLAQTDKSTSSFRLDRPKIRASASLRRQINEVQNDEAASICFRCCCFRSRCSRTHAPCLGARRGVCRSARYDLLHPVEHRRRSTVGGGHSARWKIVVAGACKETLVLLRLHRSPQQRRLARHQLQRHRQAARSIGPGNDNILPFAISTGRQDCGCRDV